MARIATNIANKLFPIRSVFLSICVVDVFCFIYLLLLCDNSTQEVFLVPCLLLFLWMTLLFVFIHSFQGEYQKSEKHSFFGKIKHKFTQILTIVYGVLLFLLAIVTLYFSIRIMLL